MIHALLISGNVEATEIIGRLIRGSSDVVLDRFFCPLPNPHELTTTLQTLSIDVAYVDVAAPDAVVPILDHLRKERPEMALVGFSTASFSSIPRGVTEFALSLPLSVDDLETTTRAALCAGVRASYSKVVAILPSKAGCGASTIAMNLAAHLAMADRRVVLVDADLRSGAIGDFLGLAPRVPLAETLSLADVATQLIWARHVAAKDGVDCLLTDRDSRLARPAWHAYYHLLPFLSDRYDQVVVDLPELTNDATSFVLQHAAHVYLAATPEPLCLKLAQQRLRELDAAGVDPLRVGLLINRWERNCMSPADISKALGRPVVAVFPNDYRGVTDAIHDQTFVRAKSKLGQAYQSLATSLAGDQPGHDRRAPGLLEALRFSRKLV